jgi:drug/metabolite transporter (DMT)-like permease
VGAYSLGGRGTTDPLGETQHNFLLATGLSALVTLTSAGALRLTPRGVLLAAVSGAVTSGPGYVAWFAALRGLTAIRAAVVQLAVPALAALGGVALLSERVTLRLLLSAVLIFAGVGVALLRHARGPGARRTAEAVE